MLKAPRPSRLRAATALAVLLGLAAGASADTIIYRADSGKQPKGGITVSKETATTITFAPAGAKTGVENPSFDVEFVEFDDAPDAFKRALAYFRKGSWYDARVGFEQALKDALDEEKNLSEDEVPTVRYWWIKPYCTFYIAECHRQRGERHAEEYEQAEARYQEVIAWEPPSRYLGPALIGLAQVQAATGRLQDGLATFDRAIDAASKKAVAPWVQTEALLARAELHRATKNASSAAADFRRLADDLATTNPEASVRYRLQAAFAFLEAGNQSQAESLFADAKKSGLAVATAGATNGLAQIALKRGDARAALEGFATTMAESGGDAVEYERALKGMAQALRALGGDANQTLADSLIRELRARNPRSPELEGEAETAVRRHVGEEGGSDE